MKIPLTIPPRHLSYCLSLLLIAFMTACSSFPKAVELLGEADNSKVKALLEKSVDHPVYGIGAKYYLNRLRTANAKNTSELMEIHQNFLALEAEAQRLSPKQAIALRKYQAGRVNMASSREDLRVRIYDHMRKRGNIGELKALKAASDGWLPGDISFLEKIIVNKNIDPNRSLSDYIDHHWQGQLLPVPSKEQIREEAGRSCRAISETQRWAISYKDATLIAKQFADIINPENYPAFWSIREDIWDLFQVHHTYCDMDRFKTDHPDHAIAKDCWYEQAKTALCTGRLRPLLAFHRECPQTLLDEAVCDQIICISDFAEDAGFINSEEKQQIADIKLMRALQEELKCSSERDPTELINQIVGLAKKYPYHEVVYELATNLLNNLAADGNLILAGKALKSFQPLFPDPTACKQTSLTRSPRQAWFQNFSILLKKSVDYPIEPMPLTVWNTQEHDEYALISFGETKEVFFVRRENGNGPARILTSRLMEDNSWTEPTMVDALSFADDVEPLSLSSRGRLMLLKSDRKLFQSQRPDIDRPWSKPVAIEPPAADFAGDAWIAPDDSLRWVEVYASRPSALEEPTTNILIASLLPNGSYGRLNSVGKGINYSDTREGAPLMTLGGRMLLFASDRAGGMGDMDLYSTRLINPREWATMDEPQNLGIRLNSIAAESGFTYFSEYTDEAYFDRVDRCTGKRDIWQVTLKPEMFPQNAMRLAGLVINENGQPIGGGFMEFTPNYDGSLVHAEPISVNGTYAYTVADSTEVVRLFPEIPGYYSENEAKHFLANITKGAIIRDTFRLTSFEYIRRNLKLVHSTFHEGKATFDQPEKAYPELTRLAKIATRMGADLDLAGHTDNVGPEAENVQLSWDRANSVKAFLVEKCGFPADRIHVAGYGSSDPECDNDSEAGRRCNRRIEVVFKMPELRRD